MRAVFQNINQEEEFQKNGFIHLSFLSKEEIKYLWDKFHELILNSKGHWGSGDTEIDFEGEITYDFTFIDKNIEHKKEVFRVIDEVFRPHYSKILKGYKPIIANYIRKMPNAGEVPMHQNWAFADERKCSTVSIWVPLVDSDRSNGALEVVPGSHKRFGENRGPLVPWELENVKNDIIQNDLHTCAIDAGETIILDDSIVHYSFPNTTNELRIAIQLILVPEEIPSLHYHLNQETGKIDVLEVDHEFYMEFNPWKKPKNVKKIDEVSFNQKNTTYIDFKNQLFKQRFDEPISFFQKLKSVFS